MKVLEHIHELHVLAHANSAVFNALVKNSTASLLLAINEVFRNISNLSFPIEDQTALTILENKAETVEELATAKGTSLKALLIDNYLLVQVGLEVALKHLG